MEGMKHIGLFAGIGGFELAASWMGWKTVAWCEWNPIGQKVLRHYFPSAEDHGDITKICFKKYADTIDILTGGFPCQPYSVAGLQKGNEDERHLWPHMLRAVSEIRPQWVVGENVPGLISWNDGLVRCQLAGEQNSMGRKGRDSGAHHITEPHAWWRVFALQKRTRNERVFL